MKTFLRILSYLRPYKWLVLVCTSILTTFAFVEIYLNLFFYGTFVDEVLVKKDFSDIFFFLFKYIFLIICYWVFKYLKEVILGRLTISFSADIRRDFYRKLVKLPYGYYVNQDKADLISRYVSDGEKSKEALEQVFDAIFHLSIVFVYTFAMFMKHSKVAMLFCLMLPTTVLITHLFSDKIALTGQKVQEQISALVTTLKDFLSGIRIIKALGTEKIEKSKFDNDIDSYCFKHLDNVKARAGFEFMQNIITWFLTLGIIIYCGYEFKEGRMTVGTFIFFDMALWVAKWRMSMFIEQLSKFQTYSQSIERMFKIVDEPIEIKENSNSMRLDIKGGISFENVYFKYSDEYAIQDINFSINPGEVVAVIGRSGSGKTTIANLILNLYSATSGRILIDGHDIEQVDKRDLRKGLSIVPQEIFLFNDTIANNIAYGSNVTNIEVEEAAEKAFVTEFTNKLPDGLDTIVAEDGGNLSGGQKQRIAIARAIVRKPKILILDEATSALDMESTKLVSEAIASAMQGNTTFMITHKISSALNADKIIVLEFGKIIEFGTHEELIENNLIYKELYRQQYF